MVARCAARRCEFKSRNCARNGFWKGPASAEPLRPPTVRLAAEGKLELFGDPCDL